MQTPKRPKFCHFHRSSVYCLSLCLCLFCNIMVAHGDSPLSQSADAAISPDSFEGCNMVDAEFRSSTSLRLASGEISTSKADDTYSSIFRAHLERFDLVKPCQERTS